MSLDTVQGQNMPVARSWAPPRSRMVLVALSTACAKAVSLRTLKPGYTMRPQKARRGIAVSCSMSTATGCTASHETHTWKSPAPGAPNMLDVEMGLYGGGQGAMRSPGWALVL